MQHGDQYRQGGDVQTTPKTTVNGQALQITSGTAPAMEPLSAGDAPPEENEGDIEN